MKDKVVLITGSTSGIGRETALHFAELGAKVVITGRRKELVNEVTHLCKQVSPHKYEALGVVGDVVETEHLNRLINATIEKFGKLDVLVNNVGISSITAIDDQQLIEKYDKIFNVNVKSVLYLCHLAVSHLEKTKGCIVNVSSVAGLNPSVEIKLYCMSKAALTKCLALELGPKGIRVNSINPGVIKTPFADVNFGEGSADAIEKICAEQYPLKRVGESIDCAKAIAFLASENASFITGDLMSVDGGHRLINLT